jgi:hypothetical protein
MSRQHRQPPGMIDMRVRQDDGIQLIDREWELRIFRIRVAPAALKHSEVENDFRSGAGNEVTGSGDFSRGAEEGDLHKESYLGVVRYITL